jgi:NitT/TauT family transport system substrate-binding protein
MGGFSAMRNLMTLAIVATLSVISSSSRAYQLTISQYGRVTATLPWAVAMEKGFFDEAGVKIDEVIAGAGGGTTLRNVLASNLPYGEVATSASAALGRTHANLRSTYRHFRPSLLALPETRSSGNSPGK